MSGTEVLDGVAVGSLPQGSERLREIAHLEWTFLVFQESGGGESNQHIA